VKNLHQQLRDLQVTVAHLEETKTNNEHEIQELQDRLAEAEGVLNQQVEAVQRGG
jgi:peptidoglycan hydrolase CwlO-like protein